MIVQYGEMSTIPTAVVQVFTPKIGLLDHYVMMRTGEYEYTMLLKKASGDVWEYVATRGTGVGYSNIYTITSQPADEYLYQYSNEYYIISNEGIGTQADLPVYSYVSAVSSAVLVVMLILIVLYKGLLFTIFRRKKHTY